LARRRSHRFPVIAASGFWLAGIAVLAVLAVGLATLPQSDPDDLGLPGVNACWASSAATTQTGSLPIAGAIAAVVRGYEGVSAEESGRGVECTV
jgi:hypothetical protein